ncbi:MAG: FtsQ-type POTRA domain-containing protein [Oscillospiraceae bacterium]|nr:FtsQ-type POTRA domain-containing protein [Oscillospiraceae bacterium]
MDTTQKNREAARQQERPSRSAGERQAAADAPRKKRPAEQPTQTTRQRQRSASQQSAETRRRTASQQNGQPRQRTALQREEGVRYSAPQGTGPRKSAPQRTPQQQKEARERAARQRKNNPDPNQKRTLKDNPLQKFMAGIKPDEEKKAQRAEQAKQRQEKRAAEAERKRKQAERNNTPAVIYTQPEVFNRNILLVRLLTVTAIVVAMIVGMSVFFKVETITVAGAETYSAWTIREASGIAEGDGLLTFSRAKANAQIQAKLPYVENSRIGIKLPNTVIIYIEEAEVTYAIKSYDGIWYLMTSSGRVVEQIDNASASRHTQISGVTIQTPTIGEQAVAMEEVPSETNESGEYVPAAITGALRLSSALQILKALEANDIVGEAASVDVTRLEDIVLWYGTRYQVELGDSSRMEYKIACMNDVILEMSEFDSGVLDISFDISENEVIYTPFS